MTDRPSDGLLELVGRLNLADENEVLATARSARRLARGLPLFDSVWVDALVARRLLTPFQASRINEGCGESLGVGPYALCQRSESLGWAESFRARCIETRQPARLLVATPNVGSLIEAGDSLAKIAARIQQVQADGIARLQGAGVEGGRLWAAYDWEDGISAQDWMIRNGRFSPQVVLEIARQMAAVLAQLADDGLVHGDVCAAGLLLSPEGQVSLLHAGIRSIARPREGYALTDVQPEAFDYLAPERVRDGSRSTPASELFACGCLWWHLLTGRPPLTGGTSLAKLKAAEAAKVRDIRWLAPETPGPLAVAITQCTQPEAARRPESFAQLAATLGPSTREGRLALAAALARRAAGKPALLRAAASVRHSRHAPVWLAALAGSILMLAALTWPFWSSTLNLPLAQIWSLENAATTNTDPSDPPKPTRLVPNGNAESGSPSPATQTSPQESAGAAGRTEYVATKHNEQLLDAETEHAAELLEFQTGQHIHPPSGTRATIVVSRESLRVDAEKVQFENIDFVMPAERPGDGRSAPPKSLVELSAVAAEFRRCTFRAAAIESPTSAIDWRRPATDAEHDGPVQPARLRIEDCKFLTDGHAIDCGVAGPVALELVNVLLVGPAEALWRLDHAPDTEASLRVRLTRCTVRDARALGCVAYQGISQIPGKIAIEASDCVLAIRPGGALILLQGESRAERLLQMIEWTGQGSLMPPDARFAIWERTSGESYPLDDTQVVVDGLVAGRFRFTSPADENPQSSEVAQWSAPLRSDEPPGIRPAVLPESIAPPARSAAVPTTSSAEARRESSPRDTGATRFR